MRYILAGKSIGNSMYPLIEQGCRLWVTKCPFNTISLGDIIVYRYNNNLVGHRVVYKIGNNVCIKGDNSPYVDTFFKRKSFVGRVDVIENQRRIKIHLTTPFSRFISYYFVFYSLVTFIPPYLIRRGLMYMFFWNKPFVKLLWKKGLAS